MVRQVPALILQPGLFEIVFMLLIVSFPFRENQSCSVIGELLYII